MSYFPCDIPFMSVDELIENDIHTPEDITGTNVKNSGFISIQEALDAVEESRRLNHHKDAKEACAHEYEHRHFLKILMDIEPADVVPVRHARWENYSPITIKCSQCGHVIHDWRYSECKYCPNCGAKMEGEAK